MLGVWAITYGFCQEHDAFLVAPMFMAPPASAGSFLRRMLDAGCVGPTVQLLVSIVRLVVYPAVGTMM